MVFTGRTASACLLAAVAVTAGVSGCGSDNSAACSAVTKEITSLGTTAMSKISDPAGLKAEYDAAAARVRKAAKGSGIADEADKVASAFETLGNQVAEFAANPSTTAPNLDQAALIQAGTDLKKACS